MSDVLAIDQGTTSTRATVFDARGRPVATGQLEHRQFFPQPGWVDHHALEMWRNTREFIGPTPAAPTDPVGAAGSCVATSCRPS